MVQNNIAQCESTALSSGAWCGRGCDGAGWRGQPCPVQLGAVYRPTQCPAQRRAAHTGRHSAFPAPCRAWWAVEARRASRSLSCYWHTPDPWLLLHEHAQAAQPEPQPLTWKGDQQLTQPSFSAGAPRRRPGPSNGPARSGGTCESLSVSEALADSLRQPRSTGVYPYPCRTDQRWPSMAELPS